MFPDLDFIRSGSLRARAGRVSATRRLLRDGFAQPFYAADRRARRQLPASRFTSSTIPWLAGRLYLEHFVPVELRGKAWQGLLQRVAAVAWKELSPPAMEC